MSVDHEADDVVHEMRLLGATFEVVRTGQDARWVYSARPGTRQDIRRFWRSVDSTRPGFGAAMLRAIERAIRTSSGGA